jgi:hypothetical protein
VLRIYERRWIIEEFHDAWKNGCGVENRRQQEPDNLERLAVILAFVAVYILQLRALRDEAPTTPCDRILTQAQWQCLWAKSSFCRMGHRGHRCPRGLEGHKANRENRLEEPLARLGETRRKGRRVALLCPQHQGLKSRVTLRALPSAHRPRRLRAAWSADLILGGLAHRGSAPTRQR